MNDCNLEFEVFSKGFVFTIVSVSCCLNPSQMQGDGNRIFFALHCLSLSAFLFIVFTICLRCRRRKRCRFNPCYLIPGSGRSSGRGNGNLLQYSWLKNPMGRGAWWETVHRVTKSWARLKWLSTHTSTEVRNSELLAPAWLSFCKANIHALFQHQMPGIPFFFFPEPLQWPLASLLATIFAPLGLVLHAVERMNVLKWNSGFLFSSFAISGMLWML